MSVETIRSIICVAGQRNSKSPDGFVSYLGTIVAVHQVTSLNELDAFMAKAKLPFALSGNCNPGQTLKALAKLLVTSISEGSLVLTHIVPMARRSALALSVRLSELRVKSDWLQAYQNVA